MIRAQVEAPPVDAHTHQNTTAGREEESCGARTDVVNAQVLGDELHTVRGGKDTHPTLILLRHACRVFRRRPLKQFNVQTILILNNLSGECRASLRHVHTLFLVKLDN